MNRRFVPLVALLAVLVSCSGAQEGTRFDANSGPLALGLRSALADDVDPENVPEAQRNFLEACALGGDDFLPDLPALQVEGLVAVCGCVYTALVDSFVQVEADDLGGSSRANDHDAIDRLAFKRLAELDDYILARGALPEDVDALVRSCVRKEAGL